MMSTKIERNRESNSVISTTKVEDDSVQCCSTGPASFPKVDSRDFERNEKQITRSELYTIFSKPTKRWIVFIVSLAGFFSPLSANIYYPALNDIAKDLHVSLELMNLTITAYLICQGIVPSIFGDLADMVGRRPVYLLVFLIYLSANVGLALQNSYPALLVLRMLQSTGSSGEFSAII